MPSSYLYFSCRVDKIAHDEYWSMCDAGCPPPLPFFGGVQGGCHGVCNHYHFNLLNMEIGRGQTWGEIVGR